MEIFKLFGSILVDSTDAEKSISKTEEKASSLGDKFKAGAKVAGALGAAVVAGAGAAGVGLFALVNKTAEAADFIDKLSERTGISREELQRWKYAADQSGADIGKLEVGVKKLSDVMDGAVNGNKLATESFEKIGISLDDLKNKSQEQIFDEVMTSLADMEQGAERNALGNDLLGKSYTELLPLLNAGSDGMQGLKDRADELGLVMSEENVKANVVFGDTLADLKSSLGAFGMTLANEVLPIFQTFIDWALANLPALQEKGRAAFAVISEVIQTVVAYITETLIPTFQAMVDQASPYIEQFKTMITEFIDLAIQKFHEWRPIVEEVLTNILTFVGETLSKIKVFWDENGAQILEAVKNAFNGIKAVIDFVMPAILVVVKFIWDSIKGVISGALDVIMGAVKVFSGLFTGDFSKMWEGVKQLFSGAIELILNLMNLSLFGGIKAAALNITKGLLTAMKTMWDDIVKAFVKGKDDAIENMNNLRTIAGEVFQAIKTAIMKPIDDAVAGVRTAIDNIKGFFSGLKLELPKIKMPSFSIQNWSANPVDWLKAMPKLTVAWNAAGGIFDKPTIFNTANAGLQGVGEAGPEAILPLTQKVLGDIGRGIAETMGMNQQPIILQVDGHTLAKITYDPIMKQYRQDMTVAINQGIGG